ncbi:MAG TPA: acetylxylan esterase [Methanotrichaceae archaeon]|nr:acetylxylan esterase [Methanotrichaceae archaeon]
MRNYSIAAGVLIAVCITAATFIGFILPSNAGGAWQVAGDGLLGYSLSQPEYELGPCEDSDNSTLCEVVFTSRDARVAGLLRRPKAHQANGTPGVVLLPGATVTKEQEQGLAKYLCSLGYASITLDQRNSGGIDMQGDLEKFLKGTEPAEHKMVHDALAAAEILRSQPEIDESRIVYAGESNGARFAIIACALDPKSRGVIAISTCGYGADEAIASGILKDPEAVRFYRSIDPETYLGKIPPRKFVMFHSQNDPIIPYEYANRTYSKALEPKGFHTVECAMHGRCPQMDAPLKKELAQMVS